MASRAAAESLMLAELVHNGIEKKGNNQVLNLGNGLFVETRGVNRGIYIPPGNTPKNPPGSMV